MRFESLKYLMEVAKIGSITKAADRLFMSKSSLSAAIKNLEDELKIPLLTRTVYGVELTAGGEMVLNKAKLIFDLVDQIEAEAWLYRELEPITQLNVYLAGNAAGDIFSLLLKDLKKFAGNARITTNICNKDVMLKNIQQEQNNIGILLASFNEDCCGIYSNDVDINEISRNKIHAIAAKYSKHIPENKTILSIEDLQKIPAVEYSGKNVEVGTMTFYNKKGVFVTDDIDIYMQAILEDIGIGFLPWNLVLRNPLFEQRVRILPVEDAHYNVLYLITNKKFNGELRAKIENSLFNIMGNK